MSRLQRIRNEEIRRRMYAEETVVERIKKLKQLGQFNEDDPATLDQKNMSMVIKYVADREKYGSKTLEKSLQPRDFRKMLFQTEGDGDQEQQSCKIPDSKVQNK